MKTIKNSYNSIVSISSLFDAYLIARKQKRYKTKVQEFELYLGDNILKLNELLKNNKYEPDDYIKFTIYEPKKRIIFAPSFKDTVVQHSIYKHIYDIFDRSFIFDSYGCRKSKGNHAASKRAQQFLRYYSAEYYYVKLDIKKFFYSIDRSILMDLIAKKISDRRLLEIIQKLIYYPDPTGIPIGNLLSQLFANVYLNQVDHYCKRVLKLTHYVRYVDDMLLVGFETYTQAVNVKNKIEHFVNTELKLELSKFSIQKIKRGVNFVGFVTFQDVKFLRKFSIKKFKKYIKHHKKLLPNIISILGNSRHSSNRNSLIWLFLRQLILEIQCQKFKYMFTLYMVYEFIPKLGVIDQGRR